MPDGFCRMYANQRLSWQPAAYQESKAERACSNLLFLNGNTLADQAVNVAMAKAYLGKILARTQKNNAQLWAMINGDVGAMQLYTLLWQLTLPGLECDSQGSQ